MISSRNDLWRARRRGLFILIWAAVWISIPNAAPADTEGTVSRLESQGLTEENARALVERWRERYPDAPPDDLADLFERSVSTGAPADLMAAKAAEGIAKGVARPRLMGALEGWGAQLSGAAEQARELRRKLDHEGVSEAETILRLTVLRRAAGSKDWLKDLQEKAAERGLGLQGFLRFGEAVTQLSSRVGLPPQAAERVGAALMEARVGPDDVGKAVRAIEVRKDVMSPAEAAREVTDHVRGGMSPDDALARGREMARAARGGPGASDDAPGRDRQEDHRPDTDRNDKGPPKDTGGKEPEEDGKGPPEDSRGKGQRKGR